MGLVVIPLYESPAHAERSSTDPSIGLTYFRQSQFAEALEAWRRSAAAGDAWSALFIGVAYDTGQGVGHDYGQAVAWYMRAADAGNPVGMFNVAVMYDAGRGVSQDRSLAANWYARAAAQGFGRAEYNLGLLYEAGDGVRQDRKRAHDLFRSATQHGIAAGRLHLAGFEQASLGRRRSAEDVAMQEFREAQQELLQRGSPQAMRAAQLFRKAAELGNALAAYDLAYCLDSGLGVATDGEQAFIWYQRAAAAARTQSLKSMAETQANAVATRLSDTELKQARRQLVSAP